MARNYSQADGSGRTEATEMGMRSPLKLAPAGGAFFGGGSLPLADAGRIGTKGAPPRDSFPPQTLQALFEAVESDDVVDPVVGLPDRIDLGCTQHEMARCLALCLQFWDEGVDRAELLGLVKALLRDGDLGPTQRRRYKLIRARYKHLRFALTLYDARHQAPLLFRLTVAIMGSLQDAYKTGSRGAVLGYALLLRAFVSRPVWAFVRHRVGAIRLDSAAGFLAYRKAQIRPLAKALERETLTGPQFHATRKVIGRHVSFYDTLRSMKPNEHDRKMSRFLSAINGLMGSRHDEMVEGAVSGEADYRSAAPLSDDIRGRLEALVAHYPL